jgi:hypothetical protein
MSTNDFGSGLAGAASVLEPLQGIFPDSVPELVGMLSAASGVLEIMAKVFPDATPTDMLANLQEAATSEAMQGVTLKLLVAMRVPLPDGWKIKR